MLIHLLFTILNTKSIIIKIYIYFNNNLNNVD